jgi:signal transduction histidine kinase
VRVADTGVGMSEEHRRRIFDLFFTTKANGLGIGMHIVFLVINAHNGEITVESEIGKGSIFTITLPEGANAVK